MEEIEKIVDEKKGIMMTKEDGNNMACTSDDL